MQNFKNIIIMFFCIAFSLCAGFLIRFFIHEYTSIKNDAADLFAIGAFVIFFIATLTLSMIREHISSDSAQDLLLSTASNLERAKSFAALFSIVFGASAALFAAQTVHQADSGSLQNNRIENAIDRYDQLEDEIEDIQLRLSRLHSQKAPAEDTKEQIADLEFQKDYKQKEKNEILLSSTYAEELRARNERQVDGVYLFDFFSSVLVRFGTIFILLYIFSILIGEYRRLDRRHMEVKQLLLAKRLNDQGITADAILNIRKALEIDDTPRTLRTNKSDLIITENFSELTSKTATAIFESAGSALQKSVPSDGQKTKDHGGK